MAGANQLRRGFSLLHIGHIMRSKRGGLAGSIAMILTVLNVYKRFYTNKVCTKSLLGRLKYFYKFFLDNDIDDSKLRDEKVVRYRVPDVFFSPSHPGLQYLRPGKL